MERKVSVIMPSLNVADYIRECIESALNQTLADIELLCVDAGSTDGTWEILNEYAKKDSRVTVIQSERKSYGYQVNLGIQRAKGAYVAILETDDYIEPNMYQYLYDIALRTEAEIIKADYDCFITCQNGKRIFTTIKLWAKQKENYNRVIDPRQIDYLYAHYNGLIN